MEIKDLYEEKRILMYKLKGIYEFFKKKHQLHRFIPKNCNKVSSYNNKKIFFSKTPNKNANFSQKCYNLFHPKWRFLKQKPIKLNKTSMISS